jgi:hypothetical protein
LKKPSKGVDLQLQQRAFEDVAALLMHVAAGAGEVVACR